MVDEVQEMPRGNGHGPPSSLGEASVGLVEGLMHVHESVDDGLTMRGRLGNLREHGREQVGTHILR